MHYELWRFEWIGGDFSSSKKRGIKVIAILWIDKDKLVNTDSISHGIALAREYPETIVRLSCGSEVRTRNNFSVDTETERCLNALRESKVSQPIGVIDTWWEWCNRSQPCHENQFSKQVDWIGINIFPWWENRHADLFPCVDANAAADFHLARWLEVKKQIQKRSDYYRIRLGFSTRRQRTN